MKILTPYKEALTEHTKLQTIVDAHRLRASADYPACRDKLHALFCEIVRIDSKKFQVALSQALLPMRRGPFPENISQVNPGLMLIKNNFSE